MGSGRCTDKISQFAPPNDGIEPQRTQFEVEASSGSGERLARLSCTVAPREPALQLGFYERRCRVTDTFLPRWHRTRGL